MNQEKLNKIIGTWGELNEEFQIDGLNFKLKIEHDEPFEMPFKDWEMVGTYGTIGLYRNYIDQGEFNLSDLEEFAIYLFDNEFSKKDQITVCREMIKKQSFPHDKDEFRENCQWHGSLTWDDFCNTDINFDEDIVLNYFTKNLGVWASDASYYTGYISYDDAKKEGLADYDKIYKLLQSGLKIQKSWADGEIYWFYLEAETEEFYEENSCGGFYGDHDESGIQEAVKDSIDSILEQFKSKKEDEKRQAEFRKNEILNISEYLMSKK